MKSFDIQEARKFWEYAKLPEFYESRLRDGGTLAEAEGYMAGYIPDHIDHTTIRHENSTAVVFHDRQTHEIIVAFDASGEAADRKDNAKIWKDEHPLGGHVHHGFNSALFKEDPQSGYLIDAVRDEVTRYAALDESRPAALNLAGFSKGGTTATAFAAQWMAEGFPGSDSNVRMEKLYTFGNPPLGDKDFTAAFRQSAERNGLQSRQIIMGNDSVPHVMTNAGPWYIPGMYDNHTGDVIHISTDRSGATRIALNPAEKETSRIRADAAERDWHGIEGYTQSFDEAEAVIGKDSAQFHLVKAPIEERIFSAHGPAGPEKGFVP